MATLRGFLDEEGFDWESGRIIVQWYDGSPEFQINPLRAEEVGIDHPILDEDKGACPSFVAEDPLAFYFPYQYDGATGSVKVYKDIERYLDIRRCPTPYPGGG